MNELFLKIINMSISASWIVIAVLLLRLVLKKAPKWVNVLLWGIVAIRLICPFSFESALSLIPSAETIPEKVFSGPSFDVQTGITPIDDRINEYLGDRYFEGVTVPANNGFNIMSTLAIIWSVGILLLIFYAAISYWLLCRKVNTAVRYSDNIFQSENVSSPFVLGIIKPKIYLPFKIDLSTLKHVVAHEQTHIRRKDHLWKPLGFFLLTIHWFNPLMWLAYVLFCRDIEFACDERVIKELGNEQRGDYTQALVTCSIKHHIIAACPLAFGEVGVKERVKSVMNYKKPAFWIIVIAIITCIIVATCFLTNPRTNDTLNLEEDSYFFLIGADDVESIEIVGINTSGGVVNADGTGFKKGEKVWLEQLDGVTDLRGYSIKALNKNSEIIHSLSIPEGATPDEVINLVKNDSWLLTPSDFEAYLFCITGKTYTYEGKGFMGSFTITLYNDGTFNYYEGMASSYFGIGTWSQNGDSIILTDDDRVGYRLVNYFKYDGNDLVFTEQNSNNFIYVKLADGARFNLTDKTINPNSLNTAINNTIIQHYASDTPDGLIHVESYILLENEHKSGTPLINNNNHMEEITVYLLVFHEKYSSYGGTLEAVGGSYVPTAITFKIADYGEYVLKEYWEPRNGSYYATDIRDKFPSAAADDALNEQAYIDELKKQNYNKALAYLQNNISSDDRIEELLYEIQTAPAHSSSPIDYISEHKKEYDELLSYGEYTLKFCFNEFLKGEQTDKRGHIMASACKDIINTLGESILADEENATTGQIWFDNFYKNAYTLATKYSQEDLKKYYPATFLLLQMKQ